MCRYQSGFFFRHELLAEYDYYWRLGGLYVSCVILSFGLNISTVQNRASLSSVTLNTTLSRSYERETKATASTWRYKSTKCAGQAHVPTPQETLIDVVV